jgi:hypothetical protein
MPSASSAALTRPVQPAGGSPAYGYPLLAGASLS